ncbi:MAG: hypothetical protein R3B99_10625 [Polyangiales bacterium]
MTERVVAGCSETGAAIAPVDVEVEQHNRTPVHVDIDAAVGDEIMASLASRDRAVELPVESVPKTVVVGVALEGVGAHLTLEHVRPAVPVQSTKVCCEERRHRRHRRSQRVRRRHELLDLRGIDDRLLVDALNPRNVNPSGSRVEVGVPSSAPRRSERTIRCRPPKLGHALQQALRLEVLRGARAAAENAV